MSIQSKAIVKTKNNADIREAAIKSFSTNGQAFKGGGGSEGRVKKTFLSFFGGEFRWLRP